MSLQKSSTPTTPDSYAPVQVVVADAFDLPSKDIQKVLEVRKLGSQAIDVQEIGGEPFDNVDLEVEGVNKAESLTDNVSIDAGALYSFGNSTSAGPLATSRFEWKVHNRSSNDYTTGDANHNPYRAYVNYVIRRLSVAEKIKHNIPLTDSEKKLSYRFNLNGTNQYELPIDIPDTILPNLSAKEIIENKDVVRRININDTGSSNSVNIAKEKNLQSRDLVAYINKLEVNTEKFNFGDKLVLQFVRGGTHDFYHLEARGMPGQSDTYRADLHIPFTDQMDVNAFASNALTGVNVKMEYTLVKRTIVEKALYDLSGEVNNDKLYNEVKDRLKAGVSLNGVLSCVN